MFNLTKTLINYESTETLLWMMDQGFRDVKLEKEVELSLLDGVIQIKKRLTDTLKKIEDDGKEAYLINRLDRDLDNAFDISYLVRTALFQVTQEYLFKFTVVNDTEIAGVDYSIGDELWLDKDYLSGELSEIESLIKSATSIHLKYKFKRMYRLLNRKRVE